jgi:hypothetical protein
MALDDALCIDALCVRIGRWAEYWRLRDFFLTVNEGADEAGEDADE